MRALNWGDLTFLLQGMVWTFGLFFISLIGGGAIGVALALMRTSTHKVLRWCALGYFRLIQGTPLLMQIFLVFFGTALLGVEVDALASAGLALSINAGAFLGEIWASSIESVAKGQVEAARTLGLRYRTTMWRIVMPQALRIATPPTVGFLVQLVKGTAMASFVGFVDLTRAGQMVNNATFQPLVIFGGVSLLYFSICWPLSLLSSRLERQLAKAYAH